MTNNIDHLMTEDRRFPPSNPFAANAEDQPEIFAEFTDELV